ncbi:alpha-2-macroglobulin family protein [Mucilaginibacter sp. PAMB04168]|uniref:alpha-2-macroglobulin family protein n=1 Tax=Mucilaginibacter sp. PAMB04168 TaxID=3138567 RepID=UPI0031F66E5D
MPFIRSFSWRSILFVTVLVFAFVNTRAQNTYPAIISRIDSLTGIGLPKSALLEVDKLDQLARKSNNTSQIIRAVVYRMTLQSYLEENALVAIINTLKADIQKSAFPTKPVLQSLLADIYWQYYQQNRWRITQRSTLQTQDADFTNWDLQTLINQTSQLYKISLQQADRLQHTKVEVLEGVLIGDKETRYLRPTLYDLLLHRALTFFLAEEPSLPKPLTPFNLNDVHLFDVSHAFAAQSMRTTDTTSTYYQGIKLLQQGLQYHIKKNNTEALIDLDLRRLSFLYSESHLAQKDSLYLLNLNAITQTYAKKPISAEAWTLIGHFYKAKNNLVKAHAAYSKAVNAYPQSLGGKNAAVAIQQMEETFASVTIEHLNVPNKPLLAAIRYQNVKRADLKIYKLSTTQLNYYEDLYKSTLSQRWSAGESKNGYKELQAFFDHLEIYSKQSTNLPELNDYSMHTTEIKLEPLPPGNYVVLISHKGDSLSTQVVSFAITRLANVVRVNPDEEIEFRVMDRQTGQPLKGVNVHASGKVYKYDSLKRDGEYVDAEEDGLTDAQGMFKAERLHAGQVMVRLTLNGDTLVDKSRYVGGQAADDEDDEPEPKTVIFTDRQIYRPGQTVYFKGLQMETVKHKSNVVANKEIAVKFLDANQKELGLQYFVTNEFGTFSGSFILPQNMLNGAVNLQADNGNINIQVEEYKRPTFKVEYAAIKESYKLNDSVKVKGTVMAFSGFGLSQARIAYEVRRTANYNYAAMRAIYGSSYYYYEEPALIATDTITSDSQGGFSINFKAITGDKPLLTTMYRYQVTATVTDAVGETHNGSIDVTIGHTDIRLTAAVPATQLAKEPAKIEVSLTTLNAQRLKGIISVHINALQSPKKLFKRRLWTLPDQYLMSRADYQQYFPEYTYANEDRYAYWPLKSKVAELTAAATPESTTVVNLDVLRKQPSGMYEIMVQATSAKGDTASVKYYMNLINEPATLPTLANWVVPVYNGVKAGEKAEFWVGTGQKSYILSEHYIGSKLNYSKWITPSKQQKITVPVIAADNNSAVQFMMVYQNRLYSSYQPIQIQHPEKQLSLKMLTFRNKLQPGQKEEWKLQVSGYQNEKQAAEVLAGMYDASLDDIRFPNAWGNGLFPYERNLRYFNWNDRAIAQQQQSQQLLYIYKNYQTLSRSYERINLFGYNYYGGSNYAYQQYLQRIKDIGKKAPLNSQLEETYKNNAALVKNGYDITGVVVSAGDGLALPGVTVKIKGTTISTITNSNGKFKIKVPKGGQLQFSFVGYITQEKATNKADVIAIKLIVDSKALKETLVLRRELATRRFTGSDLSAATIRIRGSSSLHADVVSTVRIDEPVGNAPLSMALQGKAAGISVTEYQPNEIFTSVAVAYPDGSRRVNGRLIPAQQSGQIAVRRNFIETAFFYPQLRTDENGQTLINFTMPESLTKWRFRAMAHTKNLALGYITQDVITQKQLMVSVNMPRFLREGDTITFSARVANLTAQPLKGSVQLRLFNALNMQPVNLLLKPAEANQQIEVQGGSNKAVSFSIVVPPGLDALTYRVTAASESYSDGEENTLPVLPNRTLITESMPMMVRPGQTKEFSFDRFNNNKSNTLVNKSLTLEYTQNPAWYAVQAMPYLMEFPYECSEQTFSRYFANSLSAAVVSHNPQIKAVFDSWKATDSKELLSNLEKNAGLKSVLLEETPWLRDAANEQEQKKRIALLFDLNKLSYEQDAALEKLQKQQLSGGGFPWFGGTSPDRYITQHIIAGIGQLYNLKVILPANTKLANIRNNAIRYLDAELVNDDQRTAFNQSEKELSATEIHAWYARSYHLGTKLSSNLYTIQQQYLQRAAKQWPLQNVYSQALIALTLQRYGKHEDAKAIVRSLNETAQQSADLGMYWSKNQLGWYWYQSPIETQALLIELFSEVGNQPKAVEEMKIWLLRNKQTNNWRTTKATAAACYALLMKGDSLLTQATTPTITLGGKSLNELKPELKTEAGSGYLKTNWIDEQVKPAYGKVKVVNTGKHINWGALYWQYTEQLDKVTPSNTDLTLQRKYFVEKRDVNGRLVLIAVDAVHPPKIGDVLKVLVYLKAGRDYEYVHLKDMRPAGTEPVDALSGYKYQDGLYYYQVTKDVATNFFISRLSKGNYVFEYRLTVVQPGNYSTGISSVQSMYAPEFNAHSQGNRMVIGK